VTEREGTRNPLLSLSLSPVPFIGGQSARLGAQSGCIPKYPTAHSHSDSKAIVLPSALIVGCGLRLQISVNS